MADRLLVDLGADGRVSVSTLLDGEILPTPAGESFELVWPLDADALEDLRWYLEDYLRAPFGVYGERGPQVAGRLSQWGQAVFAAGLRRTDRLARRPPPEHAPDPAPTRHHRPPNAAGRTPRNHPPTRR
ncbi:MAG: hypothetical protein ACRDTG_18605 [Pseudonocardiaceae bacterium]